MACVWHHCFSAHLVRLREKHYLLQLLCSRWLTITSCRSFLLKRYYFFVPLACLKLKWKLSCFHILCATLNQLSTTYPSIFSGQTSRSNSFGSKQTSVHQRSRFKNYLSFICVYCDFWVFKTLLIWIWKLRGWVLAFRAHVFLGACSVPRLAGLSFGSVAGGSSSAAKLSCDLLLVVAELKACALVGGRAIKHHDAAWVAGCVSGTQAQQRYRQIDLMSLFIQSVIIVLDCWQLLRSVLGPSLYLKRVIWEVYTSNLIWIFVGSSCCSRLNIRCLWL